MSAVAYLIQPQFVDHTHTHIILIAPYLLYPLPNHGRRQYDGAYGSLDALQEIAEAVGDRVDVLFDSAVRTGADVTKALALGAKAVFIGRPVIYGLGEKGHEGALHVLRCLLADLEINLGITGVHNAATWS